MNRVGIASAPLRRLFVGEDADLRRMPVALLSGFLGSGKTTLINALLRDPRMAGTAVAVNEFGAVPLDRDLIDHGADKTVVMANGCLCCNLAGDMEDAVMRLFSRRESGAVPRFDRLIIEPSGLSDPAPIAQAILRNPVMARALRLEAIVTTVDAVFAEAQLARHPETRKQVALADRLVLTKSDLADADSLRRLRGVIGRFNSTAPIEVATHGAVDAEKLFPPRFFDPESDEPVFHRSGFFAEAVRQPAERTHLEDVTAVSLTADSPLAWQNFDGWFRSIRVAHAEPLLRVKGILNVAGMAGPVVVHGVHHVLHAPVALEAWPGPERGSRLVMIVEGAAGEAIRASWTDALPGMLAAAAP
jgi:G3E family GTPase